MKRKLFKKKRANTDLWQQKTALLNQGCLNLSDDKMNIYSSKSCSKNYWGEGAGEPLICYPFSDDKIHFWKGHLSTNFLSFISLFVELSYYFLNVAFFREEDSKFYLSFRLFVYFYACKDRHVDILRFDRGFP